MVPHSTTRYDEAPKSGLPGHTPRAMMQRASRYRVWFTAAQRTYLNVMHDGQKITEYTWHHHLHNHVHHGHELKGVCA